MKKIPTLFVRDPADMRLVTREVTPGCEWVLAGEGVPTRKRDGANVCVYIGRLDDSGAVEITYLKRRNVTREERAQGKEPSLIPVDFSSPADKWLVEAFKAMNAADMMSWPQGANFCEALGEKIQGGVEGTSYRLYPFDLRPERLSEVLFLYGIDRPTYDRICEALKACPMEGIVWHHPDGRRAKIKARDFGLRWPR